MNDEMRRSALVSAPIHALAWLAWLAATMILLTLTRNPIYLALILLWIGITHGVIRYRLADQAGSLIISPLRFGLFVIIVSALFNALTVHAGRTVLFTLPPAIPLLGGPVTLEALVYGALNGAALAGLFAAFAVINRVVPVRSLIRIVPRAYYSVAVVASIAITYVPTTRRQFQQVREAQAIRGHRMKGVRSWLPLALPLLTGGLERALQLAEAMMARGFAGTTAAADEVGMRLAMLIGLVAVVSGWLLRLVWHQPVAGALLMTGGVLLLAGMLWQIGRRHPHTVYRPEPWTWAGGVVVAGALLAVGLFVLPLPGLERASIFYYPYPTLHVPEFNIWLGLGTWGLLAPAGVILLMGR